MNDMKDNDWIKQIVSTKQVEQMEAEGTKIERNIFCTRIVMDISHENALELVKAGRDIETNDEPDEHSSEVMSMFIHNYINMLAFCLGQAGIDIDED